MKQDKLFTEQYVQFNRQQWYELSHSIPFTLTEEQIANLKSMNKDFSLEEVAKIYIPISLLLNIYFNSDVKRQVVVQNFLGIHNSHVPYIIGIAGSVAVGKSTAAQVLQVLLSHWTEHSKVQILTTDCFLHTNKVLQHRGLMHKKGFPQSYDTHNMIRFLSEIKSGTPEVIAPLYSHFIYDIVPNSYKIIQKPDILILEGLNILQSSIHDLHTSYPVFASDFLDFSIYIDASEELLQGWYIKRFLKFRAREFSHPNSYFNYYSQIPEAKAIEIAINIWKKINGLNLKQNILPTRKRASLIITKGKNHVIEQVRLRR
ncbi:type I pantothenate kinase [Candidatus Profftia tarda]|uniref:Pantothenate kinase n=1 Tax=Candidatus Profftia tarda TaxID=1177216 RepID=A0A8E4MEQ9_9ENTR|nr:type I pantothenate kinase [Candidatus Profftia tarda]CAD6507470.1 Pantothenate kinase [Candidatus Profftia tarda]